MKTVTISQLGVGWCLETKYNSIVYFNLKIKLASTYFRSTIYSHLLIVFDLVVVYLYID
jgi:hypothetical protein